MSGPVTLSDFPDAPAGATLSEDGYLVVGQEAWTVQEWWDNPSIRPRTLGRRTEPYATDFERRVARCAARARWNERNRADPAYRAHERELARLRKAAVA